MLDVGCGTGATARACLPHLPPEAFYLGVDASPEMLAVAEATIDDPRARFRLAPAAEVSAEAPHLFERALSNASFWQFPAPARVIDALAGVLAPEALFVFNVPEERLVDGVSEVHPFQAALARALEHQAGQRLSGHVTGLDPNDLAKALEDGGLPLVRQERHGFELPQRELADLMEIPAMAVPVAPDLSASARAEALAEARRQVDLGPARRGAMAVLRLPPETSHCGMRRFRVHSCLSSLLYPETSINISRKTPTRQPSERAFGGRFHARRGISISRLRCARGISGEQS